MITGNQARNPAMPSNVVRLEQNRKLEAASHDHALATREAELREALAKVQALRRQHDRLERKSGSVVHTLYAARETASSRVATLTPREQQVLELVLAGRPNKIIAWELGISQRTVETRRAAIMKKTGSKSIPALARLAIAAAWDGVDGPTVQPLARFALAAD
jgi:FixJ family two-component response regulator